MNVDTLRPMQMINFLSIALASALLLATLFPANASASESIETSRPDGHIFSLVKKLVESKQLDGLDDVLAVAPNHASATCESSNVPYRNCKISGLLDSPPVTHIYAQLTKKTNQTNGSIKFAIEVQDGTCISYSTFLSEASKHWKRAPPSTIFLSYPSIQVRQEPAVGFSLEHKNSHGLEFIKLYINSTKKDCLTKVEIAQ